MNTRKLHRLAGIIMLLPFVAWSLTALYFILREGNGEAYERLEVRQYPVNSAFTIPAGTGWEEARYFRSVLGEHLLVKTDAGWRHLNPARLNEVSYPDPHELRLLVEDAISANPDRYGNITEIDGRRVLTSTGVEIGLDWDTLSLTQSGRDTRWINRLYSIHYLEWTGIPLIDRLLGIGGLGLLIYMTWTGTQLAFGRGRLASRHLQAGS